jgi:hypothetical protein
MTTSTTDHNDVISASRAVVSQDGDRHAGLGASTGYCQGDVSLAGPVLAIRGSTAASSLQPHEEIDPL